MPFDWSGLATSIAPAIVGLGSSLIMNNQVKKDAIGQANAQQALLETQYQIALQNQKNLELANQIKAPPEQKNNTLLYVGLGVGAVFILSVIVILATRKKS